MSADDLLLLGKFTGGLAVYLFLFWAVTGLVR